MTLRKGEEEALGRTVWRDRFGRGFGPVVRQTTKCILNLVVRRVNARLQKANNTVSSVT